MPRETGGPSPEEMGIETGAKPSETEKVDVVEATADLQQRFDSFIAEFARENGMDANGRIEQLFHYSDEMYRKGDSALLEQNQRVRSAVEQMRTDRESILKCQQELTQIIDRYNEGLGEVSQKDFEDRMREFNDELKKINSSAEKQGADRVLNFISADANDNSFVKQAFAHRDIATHTKTLFGEILQKIDKGIEQAKKYGF